MVTQDNRAKPRYTQIVTSVFSRVYIGLMKTILPEAGFLRLSQIVPTLVPIGKSTWWAGVKAGRFPKPLKLSSRVTVWRAADIRALLQGEEDSDARGGDK
jgi:prophage regulatory protein